MTVVPRSWSTATPPFPHPRDEAVGRPRRRRLGEVLLAEGVITAEQLSRPCEPQREPRPAPAARPGARAARLRHRDAGRREPGQAPRPGARRPVARPSPRRTSSACCRSTSPSAPGRSRWTSTPTAALIVASATPPTCSPSTTSGSTRAARDPGRRRHRDADPRPARPRLVAVRRGRRGLAHRGGRRGRRAAARGPRRLARVGVGPTTTPRSSSWSTRSSPTPSGCAPPTSTSRCSATACASATASTACCAT